MSHALSELSENVGIVVSPAHTDTRLNHIEFVQLPDRRILVVLVTTSNTIHNKLIRLEDNITQEELEQTARYLNTEYSGKSLVTIRAEILELMRVEKALYDRLLRNAILLCDMSLDDEDSSGGVHRLAWTEMDSCDCQRDREDGGASKWTVYRSGVAVSDDRFRLAEA